MYIIQCTFKILSRPLTGWPQHCILKGHHGNVTALLYPYGYSKAYKSDYLVSGGADFTVKLWDLYSGDLVANFAVHGGKVKNIISCPPDVNVRTYLWPLTNVTCIAWDCV